jgi:hypothetical protein
MNITGYKRRIKKTKKELSKGVKKIGEFRFKRLERRILCWRRCIEKLREKRKKHG